MYVWPSMLNNCVHTWILLVDRGYFGHKHLIYALLLIWMPFMIGLGAMVTWTSLGLLHVYVFGFMLGYYWCRAYGGNSAFAVKRSFHIEQWENPKGEKRARPPAKGRKESSATSPKSGNFRLINLFPHFADVISKWILHPPRILTVHRGNIGQV